MKLRFMDYLLTTLFPNEFQSPVWIANSDCSEHLLPKFCELNGSVKWLSMLASSIGKLYLDITENQPVAVLLDSG